MARLIDTSVLVTFDRRDSVISDFKRFIANDEFAISSITASEVLTGVHRSMPSARRERREQFVEAVLSETLIVPFDLVVARVHALIWADLESRGQRRDVRSAHCCICTGAWLHTHD